MKIKLFFLAIICFNLNAGAQDKLVEAPNHEIRLNLTAPVFGSFEAQFENFFKDNSSLGVNLALGFDNNHDNFTGSLWNIWSIMPNYRIYVGSKKASGLFIEAATRFSYDDLYDRNKSYEEKISTRLNVSIGTSLGWKYVTPTNLVVSTKYGVYRYLTDWGGEYFYNFNLNPQVEIAIGKRF